VVSVSPEAGTLADHGDIGWSRPKIDPVRPNSGPENRPKRTAIGRKAFDPLRRRSARRHDDAPFGPAYCQPDEPALERHDGCDAAQFLACHSGGGPDAAAATPRHDAVNFEEA
jgi:hypothetical protein